MSAVSLFQYDPLPEDKKFLECAVCLEPWTDPQEVVPCGHIFCAKCLSCVDKCPICREPVQGLRKPNRVLVQLALTLPGRCTRCSWCGDWEQFVASRHAALHAPPAGAQPASDLAPQQVTVATAPSHDSPRGEEGGAIETLALPPWEEYGIQEAEYFLVKSAAAAAQRARRMATTPPTSNASTVAAGRSGGSESTLAMTLDEARIFARLMGYPSTTPDLLAMFEEFGAYPTDALSEHQLLLWASTAAHKRRAQRAYDMTEAQFLVMLNDLHESVDFKRLSGVLTTPHHVTFVRQCRAFAMGAVTVSTESAEDQRMFHAVLQATRKRPNNSGNPVDGILLVDVLVAIASAEEGFELCDPASPRGLASSNTQQHPVPQQQPQQQRQQPPPPVQQNRPSGMPLPIGSHQPSVSARAAPYYYPVVPPAHAPAPAMYQQHHQHRHPPQHQPVYYSPYQQQQQPRPYPGAMQQPRYAPPPTCYAMPPQNAYYPGAPHQQQQVQQVYGQPVRGGVYPTSQAPAMRGGRAQPPPPQLTQNPYPSQRR